ncbi:hypothetical protein TNCV_2156621 [Trichonephila clavipes]|nr:hypothetical protein TNCV_2156621 [Trichonephila clavipes]
MSSGLGSNLGDGMNARKCTVNCGMGEGTLNNHRVASPLMRFGGKGKELLEGFWRRDSQVTRLCDHGQVTRTTPELAPLSSNFRTIPTLERLSFDHEYFEPWSSDVDDT